jgi:hypothetical protein
MGPNKNFLASLDVCKKKKNASQTAVEAESEARCNASQTLY